MPDNILVAKKLSQAKTCYNSGKLVEAQSLCRDILQQDMNHAEAAYIQGLSAFQCGDAKSAALSLERAVSCAPGNAGYRCDLGRVYQNSGRADLAEQCFLSALNYQPDLLLARQLLGDIYYSNGRLHDAIASYRQVVDSHPDNLPVIFALTHLYYQIGDSSAALQFSAKLLNADPKNADYLNIQGAIYHATRELEKAAAMYEKAVLVNPSMVDAQNNLGAVLQQMDRQEEAAEHYLEAVKLKAVNDVWSLRIDMLCTVVASSTKAIEKYRKKHELMLNRYIENNFQASPEELVLAGIFPPYALMYHGKNDRGIREKYAETFKRSFPECAKIKQSGNRKIGLLVTRGHIEIFLQSMKGIIRHIQSEKFRLVIICPAESVESVYSSINKEGLEMLALPEQLPDIVDLLRSSEFDVLYYWEIATDALNYFLPYYRIAPVQCTSWGIQVTSGIPTVDYYLSSDLVETPESDNHYTETLLRANTLLTYQYRKKLPENPKARTDFGLDESRTLYLYPQQMGKFHPDFDKVIKDILTKDPDGMLLILKDRWGYSAEKLRKRLELVLGEKMSRVIFLPRMSSEDYLWIVAAADVLLDPPYYGGVNSTYDGISLNKPVVTCESPYHIGRYTAACYRKVGLMECVANHIDEYADIAVKFGKDQNYRDDYCRRLALLSGVLFEDMDAVREHERLFEHMLSKSYNVG